MPLNLSPFLQDLVRFNKGEVMVRTVYVVGKPRSGKTTMVKTMAAKIKQAYPGKVFFVITNDYNDILENLSPSHKINIFFVDDAIRLQFSRNAQSTRNKQVVVDAAELAHLAEKRGFKEGLILVFIGSQSLTGVDFQLRSQAEIIMIKWVNLLLDKPYLELLGVDCEEISEWIKAARKREAWALSKALVVLPEGEIGWYSFTPVDCRPDKQLYHIEEEEPEAADPAITPLQNGDDINKALREIAESMRSEVKWSKKAQIYVMHLDGMTTREIAEKLNLAQSTVHEWKRQAQAEAKRRLGHLYEKIVGAKLSSQGYSAKVMGGESEPDIIAEKEGALYAVSCKIYQDAKSVVSIPAREFSPEIEFAKKNNGKVMVFFYNLSWGKEIVRIYDPENLLGSDIATFRKPLEARAE